MRHEVLVIGGGPVGLTLALLLAKQGVRVAVIEKDRSPTNAPSAVSLDDECLRIWQACGLERVIAQDWDGGQSGRVMCEYLDSKGRSFLRLTQYDSDLGYPHAVAVHLAGITDKLREQATRDPSIDLLVGHQVVGVEQNEQGVRVRCTTGNDSIRTIWGSWAVACDGGESVTRNLLGVEMPGITLPSRWLIAELEDNKMHEHVQIHCDPSRPSVTVPMPHGVRRIEQMLESDDDGGWLEDDAQVRRRLVSAWPDAENAPILARTINRFNARVAQQWRVGRFFLAGDAAHVTPPFAGQGLATGLRDASNLAFKLAGVRHGWLPDDVLDTYETERRPHQERMIRLAMRLGGVMSPRSRVRASCTQTLIRALMLFAPVRRLVQLRGPGIRPVLRDGFFEQGGKAGTYIPQPWVTVESGSKVRLDHLLGPRMTWIALGDSDSPGSLDGSRCTSDDTALVENLDFTDPDRQLQRRFGEGSLLLVRPDRVIYTHNSPHAPITPMQRKTPWNSTDRLSAQRPQCGAVSA